jgi:hypothetical protein
MSDHSRITDAAADMRRWAAMSDNAMLPSTVIEQWADAIDELTEDNANLRKATHLQGVTGALLAAAVSTDPERCLYCNKPAQEFGITCGDCSQPTISHVADELGRIIAYTTANEPPGAPGRTTLLADLEEVHDHVTRHADAHTARERVWARLYKSMKRERNDYRAKLTATIKEQRAATVENETGPPEDRRVPPTRLLTWFYTRCLRRSRTRAIIAGIVMFLGAAFVNARSFGMPEVPWLIGITALIALLSGVIFADALVEYRTFRDRLTTLREQQDDTTEDPAP